MSTLQVRDVPADVHRILKARAAASGRSLSEYALDILTRESRQPTFDELMDRVRLRGAVDIGDAAVDAIRRERDAA
jgi:plasmid stability protein